ncbi:MAG: UvrD-helicase domain-containing protein [Lachnospiraceae bacterium]|nr:UvrD-helicase domain-containing protein [Lachnospiraceae bacterium]
MTDFEHELNDRQYEAVRTVEGPVLILAGAGSGKTRVLTYRTAYLLDEAGVKPWNIIALTFTNKAAREMKERIGRMTGEKAKDIWVSTFHSTCLKIMFSHAEKLGYKPSFEIADAADQKSVIKDVCKNLNVDTKMYKEKSLLNAISAAKDELLTPQMYEARHYEEFYRKVQIEVYKAYQEQLKKNNAMDFDDLIMNTVELFRKYPEVLESYQERFRYIMVDEYQDTNSAQFELIRMLASKYRNLCVVGDDDQSIYKFRGANIRNILDFEKIYKDAAVIRLEENYRSTANILNTANQVISHNKGRKGKNLWTKTEDGAKIKYKQLDSAAGEAAFIADEIEKKVSDGKYSLNDFAILIRTNVQSKEFEDAFRVRRINYELVKGLRFWDKKVIKDVTSYLLTAVSGANDMRTSRIINVPKRGIGNASIDKLAAYAAGKGISLLEACRESSFAGIGGKTAQSMKDFSDLMDSLKEKAGSMSLSEFTDHCIRQTGYLAYLDETSETPEDYLETVEYIDKLKEALDEYEDGVDEPDLIDFMRQNGVEGNNVDTSLDENDKERVRVMTMHNAKGLEFPVVFVAGMEEGLFPGYMAINADDESEIEEERRLCYVAVTRAMKELVLTSAAMRVMNGERRFQATSRFIKEMPFGLLDMNIPESRFDRPVKFSDGSEIMPAARSSVKSPSGLLRESEKKNKGWMGEKIKLGSSIKVEEPEYKKGDRVRSFKWGEGTVLDIVKGERDYEVTVDFDSTGTRKIYAGFAKLKKL